MSNQNNDGNDTRTNDEGISLGRCPTVLQDWLGRYPTTVRVMRRKWSQELNRKDRVVL